ncbi:flagellar radial spoke protein 2-like [Lolium rigidum]|uniref:flagellar radial spoke protein 2-like n=1 Tax=Lolium rigidum TaxID=89674 RepID=UPI001F5E2012|nr:flagellar radial spoke protein 2-like [Lolium rigidum]
MTDGSDVSPAAGGEIWGTLEELVLACAVSRHGTASWEAVATEVQTRSPLAARPRLTPRSCRLRFRHLHRRFSVVVAAAGADEAEEEAAEGLGHGEVEDPDASAADAWLDELRRLRVAELRREVERCDLSIGTLQSKVELMKEERSRSRSRSASGSGEATTAAKPEGENVSCRESNSTDLKRPVKEEEGEAKQEASGESMAASKGSSASLCRRGGRKGGEEECEEAASAQPLAALLDRVAARFGPVFERLQESQESESYRGTIRRHVDLDAMRRRLDDATAGGYPSPELYRDLLLLCANAAVYLPRHAPDHAAAALDALRLVSAQVSASLREPAPNPKRELLVKTVTAAALAAAADTRRAEADIVGPLIQKAAKPLIFCRKRSSIAKSAAAAAVAAAKKEETDDKASLVAHEQNDGEKKATDMDVDVAPNDKAWGTRTKKTRGPGKNSAKALAAKAAAEAAAAATESDSNKKSDAEGTAAAGGGLPKKRIAVDFLKRLNQGASTTKKRGSPLTKRKRSAPAKDEEEEEQPKRRGPGRKSAGRGRGGKAAGAKRSVGRPPVKRAAPSVTPPPAKRAKVNRSERSSSSSRRGGKKS